MGAFRGGANAPVVRSLVEDMEDLFKQGPDNNTLHKLEKRLSSIPVVRTHRALGYLPDSFLHLGPGSALAEPSLQLDPTRRIHPHGASLGRRAASPDSAHYGEGASAE